MHVNCQSVQNGGTFKTWRGKWSIHKLPSCVGLNPIMRFPSLVNCICVIWHWLEEQKLQLSDYHTLLNLNESYDRITRARQPSYNMYIHRIRNFFLCVCVCVNRAHFKDSFLT